MNYSRMFTGRHRNRQRQAAGRVGEGGHPLGGAGEQRGRRPEVPAGVPPPEGPAGHV